MNPLVHPLAKPNDETPALPWMCRWTLDKAYQILHDPDRTNGLLTSFWGPAAWTFLHAVTFGYPVKDASDEHKQAFRDLWNSLKLLLPCSACQEHFQQHAQGPLALADSDLASRATLVAFVHRFHNAVSASLGKEYPIPLEELVHRYEALRAMCAPTTPVPAPALDAATTAGTTTAPVAPVASAPAPGSCQMALEDRQAAHRMLNHLRWTPDVYVMDTEPWLKHLIAHVPRWCHVYTTDPQWKDLFQRPRRPVPASFCLTDVGTGDPPRPAWSWCEALRTAVQWALTTQREFCPMYTCLQDIRRKSPQVWELREVHAGWTLLQWRLQEGAQGAAWTPWNADGTVPHPLELTMLLWRSTTSCPFQAQQTLQQWAANNPPPGPLPDLGAPTGPTGPNGFKDPQALLQAPPRPEAVQAYTAADAAAYAKAWCPCAPPAEDNR